MKFFFTSDKSGSGTIGQKQEAVVLLHGLARTKSSMSGLKKHLEKQGYIVVNMGYPSREKNIETLALSIIPVAVNRCLEHKIEKIHFVTHSMGGILVRYFLAHHPLPLLGRVVMLSPPNNGSEVVDKLKNVFVFKWLNGPAGQQLGTDIHSIPSQLEPPDYPVGIITGDRSVNPFLSLLIPGKNDGKVSVERAKLSRMKDFLVVHASHPFIMNSATVQRQVSEFLLNGVFHRDPIPE